MLLLLNLQVRRKLEDVHVNNYSNARGIIQADSKYKKIKVDE